MPSELGKMLSNHTTSMFEYLAPPRRRAPNQPGQGPPKPPGTSTDGQYHDRVF